MHLATEHEQKLIKLKGKIIVDRTRQKINMEIEDLNNSINHLDLKIPIEHCPTTVEYTVCSSACETFSR